MPLRRVVVVLRIEGRGDGERYTSLAVSRVWLDHESEKSIERPRPIFTGLDCICPKCVEHQIEHYRSLPLSDSTTTRHQSLDTGHWTLDTGHWTLDMLNVTIKRLRQGIWHKHLLQEAPPL